MSPSESNHASPRSIMLSAQLGILRVPQCHGHPDFMHRNMVQLGTGAFPPRYPGMPRTRNRPHQVGVVERAAQEVKCAASEHVGQWQLALCDDHYLRCVRELAQA